MEAGVEFIACDFPQANRLTVHIPAAVAEHEASMISARTTSALAAAKARGKHLVGLRGRPDRMKALSAKANAASIQMRRAAVVKRSADLLPLIASLQREGASSLNSIATALNKRGISAPRGGQWTAVQVQRVIGAGQVWVVGAA
jgi:DNA invertase Pin-like site-specific DNA recombinase